MSHFLCLPSLPGWVQVYAVHSVFSRKYGPLLRVANKLEPEHKRALLLFVECEAKKIEGGEDGNCEDWS